MSQQQARSKKSGKPASAGAAKSAAGDWRQYGGIYYPEKHVPFALDDDGFLKQPHLKLPSAESLRRLAEKFPHAPELAGAAQNAQQWEEAGEVTIEDFYSARQLIDKLLLCSAADPHALPLLASVAEYALVQLANVVAERRDKKAAHIFCSLLAVHVERLDQLAEKSPKLFQPLAYQLPSFPVMGSKFKAQQLANERLVTDRLDVGREHWIQQHRKGRAAPASKASRAKEIATQLIGYLQKYRIVYPALSARVADLPPWTKRLRRLKALSPDTWPKWFALAWEVVLETTGGKPAEVAAYQKIAGRFERSNWEKKTVKAARTAIQDALRAALQELATGKSPRAAQARNASENHD